MFEKWVVPALATVLAFLFLLTALLAPIVLLFSAGMPPCAPQSWIYRTLPWGIEISLFVNAAWMGRLMLKPKTGRFILALAIPAVLMGSFYFMHRADVTAQQRCRAEMLK